MVGTKVSKVDCAFSLLHLGVLTGAAAAGGEVLITIVGGGLIPLIIEDMAEGIFGCARCCC